MNDQYNNIPVDKFSGKLRIELNRLVQSNPDVVTKSLFFIANCELSDDSFKNLAQHPQFQLPLSNITNIELVARINDLRFILGDNKVDSIKLSTEAYLQTYKQTKEVLYLVRALQLIKKAKSLFEEQLPELRNYVVAELLSFNSSFWKLKILENAVFLTDEQFKDTLSNEFLLQLERSLTNHHYNDAQNYTYALGKLGLLENAELKMQISSCLEKEGDYYISQKEPNTYYPTILSLYIDSLKQLKGVSVSSEIRSRLEQKIKSEQRLYIEMLRKAGVNLDIDMDISQEITSLEINDFQTGFAYLLDLPIIDTDKLNGINQNREQNFLSALFENHIHYSPKGTVSGVSNSDQFYLSVARNRYRELHIKILREIKALMDFDRIVPKDQIATLVDECQSFFIPEDRKYVFIEGISCGFQNDFIGAAHILIPQIENSLKTIIELSGRNVTRLTDDIQNDNTLGSILNLEQNGKMLDGICDKNLLAELNSFLIDGNNVNFRNQLCHGLMTPLLIDHYGIYLWWLVLKLIKQTEQYFDYKV